MANPRTGEHAEGDQLPVTTSGHRITHAIVKLHERDNDLPEPSEFVADVVCRCARIFASAVHSSPEAAAEDAIASHAKHAAHKSET